MLVVLMAVELDIARAGDAALSKGLNVMKLQKPGLIAGPLRANITATIPVASHDLTTNRVGDVP